MNLTVNQSIYIHFLKVGNISNSSVLQIGSTGKMQTMAQLYNSGQFSSPAIAAEIQENATPLVPLSPF